MATSKFNVTSMTNVLRVRQQTQTTTVLFLGAKAGGLFRSSQLYKTLRSFGPDLYSLTPLERYRECYRILCEPFFSSQDINHILEDRVLLQEIGAAVPELYIAELVKQGFFNPILSVSIYGEFEEAFRQVGMKELLDFVIAWPKSGAGVPRIPIDKRYLFTFIKVFGDLASRDYNINRRLRYIEENETLKKTIQDLHDTNILIVGADQTWDRYILPSLFPRSASIWYVNDEEPSRDSVLSDYLKDCKAELILGPDGHYENFFKSLYQHIAGTAPTYQAALEELEKVKQELSENQHALRRLAEAQTEEVRITSAAPPYRAVLEVLEKVKQDLHDNRTIIQNFAEIQAKEVLSHQQVPPKSLTVKVERLYSQLPSGVLAYYDAQTMPLLKYEIVNETTEAVRLVLTAEIKGYSQPRVDTVDIPVLSSSVYYQLPRLDKQRTGTLTEFTLASVHTRVTYLKDGKELLYSSQDFEVYLMARNVIRWAVPDIVKGSGDLPLLKHIAAWVTPHTDSVKTMLRSAVDNHPQRRLDGYPQSPDVEAPRSQVKAIFQALKKVGKIAYVDSPFAIGSTGSDILQTVRLPDESLHEQQANCIDGAVLYASLMEQASLHPVIVIQTGHAFVGWKTWKLATSYEFLETTMTLSHSFEDACAKGSESYRQLQERGWFNRQPFDRKGFASLLDIKELHDSGIFPME